MKPGLMKRILTMSLCVAMLVGDCLSTSAAGKVFISAVTAEEQGPKNVKFGHYLIADEGKAIENRQKFYKSGEVILEDGKMVQIPVQGGGDYNLVKVVITDANKKVTTITEGLAGKETIDIQDTDIETDATVELFYKANTDDNFRNEVTYFDYSIMSKEKATLKLQWGDKVSGTYKGNNYQNLQWEGNGRFTLGGNVAFVMTVGEVIYVEQLVRESVIRVDNTNATLIMEDSTYGLACDKLTIAYNGGINRYGVGQSNYLAMGQTGRFHDIVLPIQKDGMSLDANANNQVSTGWKAAIIPNLIDNLSGEGYKQVNWNVNQPGYFTAEPLTGKTIYDDRFELKFARDGHKYVLISSVDNRNNEKETLAGENNESFFPLNDVPYEDTKQAVENTKKGDAESLRKGNCFYGMRYDFTFKLGDYEGPLQYKFVGDDDLWVFLDGKRVLDLGGLHQKYRGESDESNYVNLWDYVDAEDTEKVHQVTVLYMERGAWDSTCHMEFVVPNAAPMDTVITDKPTANIEFKKVDAENTKVFVAGAEFGLFKEGQDTYFKTAVSDINGEVQFTNVKPGKYYVKEISAPEGYELNEKEYPVEVPTTIKTGDTITVTGDGKGIIKNQPNNTMDVWFRKQNADNESMSLAGAEFTFESVDGTTYPKMTATTNSSGHVEFFDVPKGTYKLTETKAPIGYGCPDEPWIVEVSACDGKCDETLFCHQNGASGKGMHFQITDGPTNYFGNALWQPRTEPGDKWTSIYNDLTSEFQFKKVDAETDEVLEGIEFKLYAVGAGENGEDVLVDTVKSDANGVVKFESIIKGTYRLEETKADGYVAAGPWTLEAVVNEDNTGLVITLKDKDGKVVEKDTSDTYVIENTPEKGSLTITKNVDKVNLVFGAPSFTFKIEGISGAAKGLILYRSITFENETELTKSITINNLPIGQYKVTELETLRYTLVDSKEINNTVIANKKAEFEFTNNLTDDKRYSHSDIVINSFRKDENGNIVTSQTREVTEDKLVED